MYHAKESERGTLPFFTAELNARARERMALDGKLREAPAPRNSCPIHQPQWFR